MPEFQENSTQMERKEGLMTQANDQVPVNKEVADNTRRMEQFQAMMTEIIRNAIEENNENLSKEVGEEVRTRILKEMNYLAREQEDAQEERYRKLDALIRQNMKVKQKKEKKLFHKRPVVQPNEKNLYRRRRVFSGRDFCLYETGTGIRLDVTTCTPEISPG